MRPNPRDRPKAPHVEQQIALIGGLARATGGSKFSRPCCGLGMFVPKSDSQGSSPCFSYSVRVMWGNTYEGTPEVGWHPVTYFIDAARADLVEKVHLYVVSVTILTLMLSLTGNVASKF